MRKKLSKEIIIVVQLFLAAHFYDEHGMSFEESKNKAEQIANTIGLYLQTDGAKRNIKKIMGSDKFAS